MISFYKSVFSKLTLFVLLSVLFMFLGGILVSNGLNLNSCSYWPICLPVGYSGFALLLHRITVFFSFLSIIGLLFEAWNTQRDNRIILPLSTISVLLFFCQSVIGALEVTNGYLTLYIILHKVTSVLLITNLLVLFIAARFFEQENSGFPPLNFLQRIKDIFILVKPIIVLLLLVTTFSGMVSGGKGWPPLSLAFWTLCGGALAAGGASAINQYIDRNLDKNM
ncbi:MAG: UbiA family prenyltransferase, partial [Chloroflexota bacterium]